MDVYDFANYAKTFSNQKRLLKEKFETDLIIFYNGGEFSASTSRISYLNTIEHNTLSTIEIDDKGTPIRISNIDEFLATLVKARNNALQSYFDAYEELKSNRSVQGLVNG
jgi:hypothetical protein